MRSYLKILTIVLFLHITLIALLSQVKWTHNSNVGWSNIKIVQSYVFAPKETAKQTQVEKSSDAVSSQHKYKQKKHSAIKQPQTSKAKHSQKSVVRSSLSHGQYNKLLIQLHNAIAKKQVYPSNAELLNQQGAVMVGFVLLASGKIINVHLIQSSGFDDLDKSALVAVKAISPFHYGKAHGDLHLSITVEFGAR